MTSLHDRIRQITDDMYWIGNPALGSHTDWHMIDGLNVLVTRPMEGDEAVVPAPITMCGVVSGEKYRLLADGLWNARFMDETPIHWAKATAFLEAAFIESLTQIWAQQLGGLVKIQNSKTTVGAKLSNVIVHQSSVKIRHALFKKSELPASEDPTTETATDVTSATVTIAADIAELPGTPLPDTSEPEPDLSGIAPPIATTSDGRETGRRRSARRTRESNAKIDGGAAPSASAHPHDEGSEASTVSTTDHESQSSNVPISAFTNSGALPVLIKSEENMDLHDPFSLRNWPASTPEGKLALEAMLEEGIYEPVPIPAFDINDRVIKPPRYEQELKGAVVCVTMTLVHQYLRSIKTDNFFADIQEIKVLQCPLPVVVTPSKRKLQDQLENLRASRKARAS